MSARNIERKCCGCQQTKNRIDMIKLTAEHESGKIIINPDNKTFGRSVYLCRNESCLGKAFKKKSILKLLKNKYNKTLENDIEKIRAVLESIIVIKL